MATNPLGWIKQKLFGQISCQRCSELMQLMTDGQASAAEEKEFNKHIYDCLPCYETYQLDKSIKEMLRTKLEKKQVPDDLIESIRKKIRDTA